MKKFVLRLRICLAILVNSRYERAGQFICNRFSIDDDVFDMNDATFLSRVSKK